MPVYLDHNASTAIDERVLAVMQPYLGGLAGNASSLHRYGRLLRDAVETARQQLAEAVGVQPEQVLFTSGGTESNNLVLQGVPAACGRNALAIAATEHPSVLEPAEAMAQQGTALHILPVDHDGRLLQDEAMRIIDGAAAELALVSVMLANNETGVLQDIAGVAARARGNGIWMHTDATQMFGKMPLNFADCGVHAMTLSAHKIYGPQGAGALVVDKHLPLAPRLFGGAQERGFRAGTENVAAIAGFGAAAEFAMQELAQRAAHTRAMRDALQHALQQMPGVQVFAGNVERLPNTLQFGVAGFDGETLLMQLDRKGFAVSSGSACASGKTEASHVLRAMQVDDALALSAVRVSFGKQNTMQDVDAFVDALQSITAMKTSAVMMAARI